MKHFEPAYNSRGDSPVDLSGREGYEPEHTAEELRISELETALGVIVGNATIIPDPSMQGATDCYAVTLDDISNAIRLLTKK